MNWIGLTIFVFLPAIGAIFAFRSLRLLRLGVRVPGSIKDYAIVREGASGDYNWQHYPIVSFCDADGQMHTLTMSVSERPVAEKKRKPVRMIYPKGKPEAARIANFGSLWLLPLVFFTPALILAAFAGVHMLR